MAIIGHTGLLYHCSLPTNMLDMAVSPAESSEVFLGKFFSTSSIWNLSFFGRVKDILCLFSFPVYYFTTFSQLLKTC